MQGWWDGCPTLGLTKAFLQNNLQVDKNNKKGNVYKIGKSNGLVIWKELKRALGYKCSKFKVGGSFPIGELRKTWNEVIRSDLKEKKVRKDLGKDINVWKSFIQNSQIS